MRINCIKTPAGALAPANEEASNQLRKLLVGSIVTVEVKQARNYQFHKKLFALFKLAFDAWEPQDLEYKGNPVEKNFDRFRKDLTILAGFYKAVTNIRGETRLEADSISFSSMSAARFDDLYNKVLDVAWRHVLQHANYKDTAAVNEIIERLLGFE